MIEKITDQNLERYDSRLKEWCDKKFFEKGNYGKYETTEESGAVAFYPAPNTPLEGKVKFSFKETPPTSGDKGPENPSTISGVSSIGLTVCQEAGVDEYEYTISLGNTYYGGEIDLATGLMTVTHEGHVFDGTEQWRTLSNSDGTNFRHDLTSLNYQMNRHAGSDVCSHFQTTVGNLFRYYASGMFGDMFFVVIEDPNAVYGTNDAWLSFLAAQKANGTPVTICYALYEPYTVQLSPLQILSLSQTDKYTPRLNTVYTDADSVQISYLKSPIRDEYEKTQAILSLGGNS